MDFNDTPQEAAYRQKVRTWLASDPVFDPLRGSDAFDQLVAG